jgi:hypothetical protein
MSPLQSFGWVLLFQGSQWWSSRYKVTIGSSFADLILNPRAVLRDVALDTECGFGPQQLLASAKPDRLPLDPVRFVNRSELGIAPNVGRPPVDTGPANLEMPTDQMRPHLMRCNAGPR